MFRKVVAVCAIGAALSACVKAEVPVEEQQIWGRFDCRRMVDHPELQPVFDQAKTICMNRAQASAVAGTTGIPVGRGLGGAIASGIERGMAQNEIGSATALSCMAEQGWALRKRGEHEAICAAPIHLKEEEQRKSAAKSRPARKPIGASPAPAKTN